MINYKPRVLRSYARNLGQQVPPESLRADVAAGDGIIVAPIGCLKP